MANLLIGAVYLLSTLALTGCFASAKLGSYFFKSSEEIDKKITKYLKKSSESVEATVFSSDLSSKLSSALEEFATSTENLINKLKDKIPVSP